MCPLAMLLSVASTDDARTGSDGDPLATQSYLWHCQCQYKRGFADKRKTVFVWRRYVAGQGSLNSSLTSEMNP
jgi:hypothetical protein